MLAAVAVITALVRSATALVPRVAATGKARRRQPPGGWPPALLALNPKREDLGSDDRLSRYI
jgi:hypothetical protein